MKRALELVVTGAKADLTQFLVWNSIMFKCLTGCALFCPGYQGKGMVSQATGGLEVSPERSLAFNVNYDSSSLHIHVD